MFGLTTQEEKLLRKLKTPTHIQDYLDRLPINFETKGDTHHSPRVVLREKTAHCIEGALLAATALWLQGKPPLLLDLKTKQYDDEHVVALFKDGPYWGAISKTNHAVLRYRDPIYKTVRELALSYFHEYFLIKTGEKTLVSYSKPFDLRTIGHGWVTDEQHLFYLDDLLNNHPHYPLVPKGFPRKIRPATKFERIAASLSEWKSNYTR
jgi:hypothetical protein